MKTLQNVCGVVIFKHESILTIFKNKYNRFELPGGKIEPGESLEEATIRETYEEIGCHVSLNEKVGVYKFSTPSGPKVIHLYKGTIIEGHPHIMEPEKFKEIFYIPINQYLNYSSAPYIGMFCQDYQLKKKRE